VEAEIHHAVATLQFADLGGAGVAAQGLTHHITLENLVIRGVGSDQQVDGISTAGAPALRCHRVRLAPSANGSTARHWPASTYVACRPGFAAYQATAAW